MSVLEIREVGYDHPDAELLIAEVQAEYVVRYGGPDESPVHPGQFSAPDGLFAIGYRDQLPVVMGGWRLHEPDDPDTGWAKPVAEVKRMYVVAAARGAGFAREMLAFLERTAAARGARWGINQRDAAAAHAELFSQRTPA